MARNQKLVYVLCICLFNANSLLGKIFSKSLSEFRLFQKPHFLFDVNDANLRIKRASNPVDNSTTDHADTFHSQNKTLLTTSFALHGELDNEAFVHWAGENNDVSFNFHFNFCLF